MPVRLRRDEAGSALVLVPVVVLVLVGLLTITVDVAYAHLEARRLEGRAAALANDLVVMGLDVETFQTSGEIRLLPQPRLARLAVEHGVADATVRRIDDRTVEVSLSATVTPLLGLTVGTGLGPAPISTTISAMAATPD